MLRRVPVWIVFIALLVIRSGFAQQQQYEFYEKRDLSRPDARTFRYQSEWKLPVKNARAFAAELEKNVRPVLQKMMQQGTVWDYGTYMNLVNEDEISTNGYWFGVPTMVALGKALDEVAKLPASALADSAIKQHDYLLRRELRLTRPSNGTNGCFYFNSTLIQPGKQGQWREWWDRYQKPLYEKFLADGMITSYEIATGEMHTMDPNYQYLIWVTPSDEALDKMNDAWVSRGKHQTPEEKRAMASGLAAVVVSGSHRDYFARAMSYASK